MNTGRIIRQCFVFHTLWLSLFANFLEISKQSVHGHFGRPEALIEAPLKFLRFARACLRLSRIWQRERWSLERVHSQTYSTMKFCSQAFGNQCCPFPIFWSIPRCNLHIFEVGKTSSRTYLPEIYLGRCRCWWGKQEILFLLSLWIQADFRWEVESVL